MRYYEMNHTLQYQSHIKTISKYLNQTVSVDGNLAKPAWAKVSRVFLRNAYSPDKHYPDLHTAVATQWTETHIYFAFWSHYREIHCYDDEDPALERWQLWDRDVVEVFINPFPDRMNVYWEFEVAPNNQWVDLAIDLDRDPIFQRWNSEFDHATRIDEVNKMWTCEMRIPVSSMGVTKIKPGMEWRINFFRCDGEGPDTKRRFLAWSPPLEQNFHVPARFGLIEWVGE